MSFYNEHDLSADTLWRSLILFGKNTATYKFAFGKTLLDYIDEEKTVLTLEDLAEPFSHYLIQHLRTGYNQGNEGQFITTLNSHIKDPDSTPLEKVIEVTKRDGFKNVVNAFQNVDGGTIPRKFYDGEYKGKNTRIVLTDELLGLRDNIQYENFMDEAEARWRLVETAWNLKINPQNLEVEYDELGEMLFIETDIMKRVDVSNTRDSLNGYQKGKCFYCCDDISIVSGSENVCHVDHLLPHANKRQHLPANINGVWNLVLACSHCNGASEKGAKTPTKSFLEKLHTRNEYYISSKHPLAETIVNQTGKTTRRRQSFLMNNYNIAISSKPLTWSPSHIRQCLDTTI